MLVALFGVVARNFLYHRGISLYHCKRRAQIVRYVCKQFLLETVGLFNLGAGIVQRVGKLGNLLVLRRGEVYVVVALCHLICRGREAFERVGDILRHTVRNQKCQQYYEHAYNNHIHLNGVHCVVGNVQRIAHHEVVARIGVCAETCGRRICVHVVVFVYNERTARRREPVAHGFAHAVPILPFAFRNAVAVGNYYAPVTREHGNIHIVFKRLPHKILVERIHACRRLVEPLGYGVAYCVNLISHKRRKRALHDEITDDAYKKYYKKGKQAEVPPQRNVQAFKAYQLFERLFFRLQTCIPVLLKLL